MAKSKRARLILASRSSHPLGPAAFTCAALIRRTCRTSVARCTACCCPATCEPRVTSAKQFLDAKGLGSACLRVSVREWGFETKRKKKKKRGSAREIKGESKRDGKGGGEVEGESEGDGENRVRMKVSVRVRVWFRGRLRGRRKGRGKDVTCMSSTGVSIKKRKERRRGE